MDGVRGRFRVACAIVLLVLCIPVIHVDRRPQWTGNESWAATASLSPPSFLRLSRIATRPLIPNSYGGGGRFTSIAFDSTSPGTVYLGSDVAGVFRKRNGEDAFQITGRNLEGFAVADLAINPHAPQQVLLLTDEGLYTSEDQGSSWQKQTGEIHFNARRAGSHLIAFSQENAWVATEANGVFRASFSASGFELEKLNGLETAQITCLVFQENQLYAGSLQGVYRYSNGQWVQLNQGLSPGHSQVVDLVAHPGGRLYLVEKESGVYAMSSLGTGWNARSKPQEPNTFKALAVSPRDPDVLLLASHPENWPYRLYKSSDGGMTWKTIESFRLAPEGADNWADSLNSIEEIAFFPDHPDQVWLTDWWNVWRSVDEGEAWTQEHHGLQNTVINDIKTHPSMPGTLFLCVADNGLMVSEDGGLTWKRKMKGVLDGHAREIEISALNPSRMYLLAQPWGRKDRVFVYMSTDAGSTWQDISFPVPSQPLPQLGYVDGSATNLELDPTTDETVYVGTNGYGVFKSVDGGRTWQTSSTGLITPYIKGPAALQIRPGNPQTLYASTQGGGVFLSTDGARTWKSISPAFNFTFGMAIDSRNPNRILAARPEKCVLLSEDGGSHWREIRLPGVSEPHIASYAVGFSRTDPRYVAVGTIGYDCRAGDGVFISADGGGTFESYQSDLPGVSVNSVVWTADPELPLLIGFNGIGLFKGGPRR
ncbi:MAG: hypothetical protein AB9873_05745 [Syntrophobacteraceae bacterium]